MLLEAKAARWSSDELRAAGYTSDRGMSAREFFDLYQAGSTNFSGLDFAGEDFSLMVLDKPCNFGGCNFTDATFHHAKLVGLDLSGATMTRVDLNDVTIENCDFTGATLPAKAAWAKAKNVTGGKVPMKQLGFTSAEAKALGIGLGGVKAAGYTCHEAEEAGWSYHDGYQAGYHCCCLANQTGVRCRPPLRCCAPSPAPPCPHAPPPCRQYTRPWHHDTTRCIR